MSSFIIKRSRKPSELKTIEDMPEQDTKMVLSGINTKTLDKEHMMKDVKVKIETKLNDNVVPFTKTSLSTSLGLGDLKKGKKKISSGTDFDNITTSLESLGISNHNVKVNYITVSSNIKLKMYTNIVGIGGEMPSRTNICCWWCRHTPLPDCHPLGLPIKIEKKALGNEDAKRVFETEGLFCSFNCMLAYLNVQNKTEVKYRLSYSLLLLLFQEIFQYFPTGLVESPDWKVLKDFGGNLTIDEYRMSIGDIVRLTPNHKYNIPIKTIDTIFIEQ